VDFSREAAERLIQKAFRLPPGNPGIPAASVNRALCLLCALEYSILGPLRLPFGTTLFNNAFWLSSHGYIVGGAVRLMVEKDRRAALG
jgi:hypothetical protein